MTTLRAMWEQWRLYEPTRLRAAYVAVVALATTLGVALPGDTDPRIAAVLGLLAVVLPALQGELTRSRVVPIVKVFHRESQAYHAGLNTGERIDRIGRLESAGRHTEGVPVEETLARARSDRRTGLRTAAASLGIPLPQ